MRFLDALLGRTRAVQPDLDALFAVPAAATTLQAALDLEPTGVGAVCFRTAEGPAAARAESEALSLLTADQAARVATSRDEYGYTWIAGRHDRDDLAGLVTDLHAVNSTLADAGYGPSLLCTVIGFTGATDGRRLGLVYLFKRGTFYPFAPSGAQTRDNALELQVRAQLGGELPVEPDLSRWFPIWTTPAL
ncbi:PspA-associated protein PspAB [Dactylosporangium sp. CA-052675]|uniref:PspA-associated protein PspAB n=1 Tax=Dactylosporangium sp. CA-052675 TaxID=3239927 RepID=UPI003D934FF1